MPVDGGHSHRLGYVQRGEEVRKRGRSDEGRRKENSKERSEERMENREEESGEETKKQGRGIRVNQNYAYR